MTDKQALELVRHEALWFEGGAAGLAPLLERIGDARVVLIGEATHGTDEFYRIRADLTCALIQQHGFKLVCVEADWPDAYRANRWVRHASADPDAVSALADFTRFPRWMWRNTAVVDFLIWLRAYNAGTDSPAAQVGFYGLDLYSLHASMEAVLRYLARIDPDAARRARTRYACFEDFSTDPQGYGYAATLGLSRSCENDVVAQLVDLRQRAAEYAARDGFVAEDEYFFAEQNARLVRNAEQYYRSMFGGRSESWNLRDSHMMETLQALLHWAGRRVAQPKAVVWAHNSHLGDARATQMASYGELNLGQLVREEHRDAAFLIGFTTHDGAVTAARDWDDPAERRQVRPSLAGSYERLFHDTGLDRFALPIRNAPVREALQASRLERAIGVVYKPETKRMSHYFRADLSRQFDAVIHIDRTRALEPLEPWSVSEEDFPETWPTGV
jgi:erythromycin esterase-like protein